MTKKIVFLSSAMKAKVIFISFATVQYIVRSLHRYHYRPLIAMRFQHTVTHFNSTFNFDILMFFFSTFCLHLISCTRQAYAHVFVRHSKRQWEIEMRV